MVKTTVSYINRTSAIRPDDFCRFRVCGTYVKLTKLADPQSHWYSVAPPGVTNPVPMFETQASIQGASCAC